MTDFPSGFEKRRGVRVPFVFDAHYGTVHPPEIKIFLRDRVDTGRLLDVSEYGVSFYALREFPKNTELEVSFEIIFKETAHPITAQGIVRFCSTENERGQFRIGFEFLKIEQAQRDLIASYVRGIL